MSAIVNISKETSLCDVHTYEVRINQKILTTFTHKPEEGLAQCLRQAAEAVEEKKWERVIKELLEGM